MKRYKIMTGMVISLIITATLCAFIPSEVEGAAPKLINFQGILKDGSGNPVPNSGYMVTFTIYNAPAGGINLWSETQAVTTAGGLFSVLLGAATPVPDSAFQDTTRYLGIKVGADPEMTPRQQLVSVAYGFRISSVDGASGGTITSKVSIGPGHTNTGTDAFVAGMNNTVSGNEATVSGGQLNTASNIFATVSGGVNNTASGISSTVGGGFQNHAANNDATVSGGVQDSATGFRSTIGGGELNKATNDHATVGGGGFNTASATFSTVSGGSNNLSGTSYATVAGGSANEATGTGATISGGLFNKARGIYSVVSGGGGLRPILTQPIIRFAPSGAAAATSPMRALLQSAAAQEIPPVTSTRQLVVVRIIPPAKMELRSAVVS